MSPDILSEVDRLIKYYRAQIGKTFIEENPGLGIDDVLLDGGAVMVYHKNKWKYKSDFESDEPTWLKLVQLENDLNFEL